ncbi:hypothetical protein JCM10908_007095 [Rhodotorula pacifica]|uniref:uncharacterized protein n=1 Tax=Rhodotorula pacifica TaxID=1495444 RepID=UPI003175184D
MCIVLFTANDKYMLAHSIVASNRDEFLARPTTAAAWHAWDPVHSTPTPTSETRVLSGLDLTAGGTWFGISLPQAPSPKGDSTATLRFATLTNYTESVDTSVTGTAAPPKPSRGNLVRDFLDPDPASVADETGTTTNAREEDRLQAYLDKVQQTKQAYAGFNLLIGEIDLAPSSSSGQNAQTNLENDGRTPTYTHPRTGGEEGEGGTRVRLGYTSNRESSSKRARVLPSLDTPPSAPTHSSPSNDTDNLDHTPRVHVRGLSNATLEVEPGEEEWPKVKSGAKAVEEVVVKSSNSRRTRRSAAGAAAIQEGEGGDAAAEDGGEREEEEELVRGLYNALSTAHPLPIQHREHLRQTVLVRPLYLDPTKPLQKVPPPFPPPPSSLSSELLDPSSPFSSSSSAALETSPIAGRSTPMAPPSSHETETYTHLPPERAPSSPATDSVTNAADRPGSGVHWYATRVQTLLLVERKQGGKVIFMERDAYVLDSSGDGEQEGADKGAEEGVRKGGDDKGREDAQGEKGGKEAVKEEGRRPRWSGQERRYEFRL